MWILAGATRSRRAPTPWQPNAEAAQWDDLLDLSIVPVIEDGDAGAVLAKQFKK